MTDITSGIADDLCRSARFRPFATTPPRTLAQGYEQQDSVVKFMVESGNRAPVTGWKIAANSQMLLDRFQLSEPISARIFGDQRHESPTSLKASDFRQFAFEPEIAAIMKTDLPTDSREITSHAIVSAIDRFVPAVELLDMRETEMESVHLPDVVAQNVSNAGVIVGGPGVPPSQLRFQDVRTVVQIDDATKLDVTGAAPQPPLDAVAWLVKHICARGYSLSAGDILLCGTHCPIWYFEETGDISLEMSGLGKVMFSLT